MNIPAILSSWSIEPAIVAGLAIAAVLYWLGVRYSRRAGLARRLTWWRSAAFAAGLLVVFFALDGPMDAAADTWLTAHMAQHELLVMVAAPLLLFGAPLWPWWRAVPLATRRATLGWAIRHRWPRRIGHALSVALFGPIQGIVFLIAGFSVWHLPALYDAALRNDTVHALEHITFLIVALLFWAQVIPSRPLQPRLGYVMRVVYVGIAGLYSSVMGSAFMFSTAPFYPYYAALARPAGAPSALVDQHIAGSAMDIPGVLIFLVAMCVLLWLWLSEDERQADPIPARSPALRAAARHVTP